MRLSPGLSTKMWVLVVDEGQCGRQRAYCQFRYAVSSATDSIDRYSGRKVTGFSALASRRVRSAVPPSLVPPSFVCIQIQWHCRKTPYPYVTCLEISWVTGWADSYPIIRLRGPYATRGPAKVAHAPFEAVERCDLLIPLEFDHATIADSDFRFTAKIMRL